MQKWISVKDSLPEEQTWVLVYERNFFSNLMDLYVYIGDNEWQDCDGRIFKMYEKGSTHWMPLPEPPKGEKHEQQRQTD